MVSCGSGGFRCPNIIGSAAGRDFINAYGGLDTRQSGVFFWNQQNAVGSMDGGSHRDPGGTLNFDASREESLFGKSSTVQPQSLRLIPCIKI